MSTALQNLWTPLAATPLLWLVVTLTAYVGGRALQRACGGSALASPVLIAIFLVAGVVLATGTSYHTYFSGAQFINFLLGPATIALAIGDENGGGPGVAFGSRQSRSDENLRRCFSRNEANRPPCADRRLDLGARQGGELTKRATDFRAWCSGRAIPTARPNQGDSLNTARPGINGPTLRALDGPNSNRKLSDRLAAPVLDYQERRPAHRWRC